MNQRINCLLKITLPAVLVFFSLLSSVKITAQGNLLVTPRRVVFDGVKKSEELNLANIGKDSATYVISFIQIRMRQDGSFEKITTPDPEQNFADKNLRYFPRTVTLAPGEAQSVKVQLTKTNNLAPGEYRSHLYFRAIPNGKPLGEPEPETDSVLSVKLVPVFGISIPVIIRLGESNASVNISDVQFQIQKDSVQAVNITFNRTGNMSVYGDVAVDYISEQGKTTRVGNVKGLAVYTPNTTRQFHLLLDKVPGIDYHSGKLHVVYADQSAKAVKLAEQEVALK